MVDAKHCKDEVKASVLMGNAMDNFINIYNKHFQGENITKE